MADSRFSPRQGLFYKPRTTLTGPETPIFLPEVTRGEGSDYEVEICAVIGKPGKDISVEKAYEHVLAYCTVNDVSYLADLQGGRTRKPGADLLASSRSLREASPPRVDRSASARVTTVNSSVPLARRATAEPIADSSHLS